MLRFAPPKPKRREQETESSSYSHQVVEVTDSHEDQAASTPIVGESVHISQIEITPSIPTSQLPNTADTESLTSAASYAARTMFNFSSKHIDDYNTESASTPIYDTPAISAPAYISEPLHYKASSVSYNKPLPPRLQDYHSLSDLRFPSTYRHVVSPSSELVKFQIPIHRRTESSSSQPERFFARYHHHAIRSPYIDETTDNHFSTLTTPTHSRQISHDQNFTQTTTRASILTQLTQEQSKSEEVLPKLDRNYVPYADLDYSQKKAEEQYTVEMMNSQTETEAQLQAEAEEHRAEAQRLRAQADELRRQSEIEAQIEEQTRFTDPAKLTHHHNIRVLSVEDVSNLSHSVLEYQKNIPIFTNVNSKNESYEEDFVKFRENETKSMSLNENMEDYPVVRDLNYESNVTLSEFETDYRPYLYRTDSHRSEFYHVEYEPDFILWADVPKLIKANLFSRELLELVGISPEQRGEDFNIILRRIAEVRQNNESKRTMEEKDKIVLQHYEEINSLLEEKKRQEELEIKRQEEAKRVQIENERILIEQQRQRERDALELQQQYEREAQAQELQRQYQEAEALRIREEQALLQQRQRDAEALRIREEQALLQQRQQEAEALRIREEQALLQQRQQEAEALRIREEQALLQRRQQEAEALRIREEQTLIEQRQRSAEREAYERRERERYTLELQHQHEREALEQCRREQAFLEQELERDRRALELQSQRENEAVQRHRQCEQEVTQLKYEREQKEIELQRLREHESSELLRQREEYESELRRIRNEYEKKQFEQNERHIAELEHERHTFEEKERALKLEQERLASMAVTTTTTIQEGTPLHHINYYDNEPNFTSNAIEKMADSLTTKVMDVETLIEEANQIQKKHDTKHLYDNIYEERIYDKVNDTLHHHYDDHYVSSSTNQNVHYASTTISPTAPSNGGYMIPNKKYVDDEHIYEDIEEIISVKTIPLTYSEPIIQEADSTTNKINTDSNLSYTYQKNIYEDVYESVDTGKAAGITTETIRNMSRSNQWDEDMTIKTPPTPGWIIGGNVTVQAEPIILSKSKELEEQVFKVVDENGNRHTIEQVIIENPTGKSEEVEDKFHRGYVEEKRRLFEANAERHRLAQEVLHRNSHKAAEVSSTTPIHKEVEEKVVQPVQASSIPKPTVRSVHQLAKNFEALSKHDNARAESSDYRAIVYEETKQANLADSKSEAVVESPTTSIGHGVDVTPTYRRIHRTVNSYVGSTASSVTGSDDAASSSAHLGTTNQQVTADSTPTSTGVLSPETEPIYDNVAEEPIYATVADSFAGSDSQENKNSVRRSWTVNTYQNTVTLGHRKYKMLDVDYHTANGHIANGYEKFNGEESQVLHEWDPRPLVNALYSISYEPRMETKRNRFINMEGHVEVPSEETKTIAELEREWKQQYMRTKEGRLQVFVSHCAEESPVLEYVLSGCDIDANRDERTLLIQGGTKKLSVLIRVPSTVFDKWRQAIMSHTASSKIDAYVKPIPRPLPHISKSTVIIELGSCSIRGGILNQQPSLPQSFFPAIAIKTDDGRLIVGADAYAPEIRHNGEFVRPIQAHDPALERYTLDKDVVIACLRKVVDDLGVDPARNQVLLSIPQNIPNVLIGELITIALQDINFQGAAITRQPSLILYAYDVTTGVVVDIGDRLNIVPVIDGYVVDSAICSIPYGAIQVREALRSNLCSNNKGLYSFQSPIEKLILRYVMEQTSYVPENCAKEEEMKKDEVNVSLEPFNLPAGTLNNFNIDGSRFTCTEGLFNPKKWGLETKGLHQLVHDAVQQSPIDSRRNLYRNIFLAGGASLLPGLAERLEQELSNIALNSIHTQVHISPWRYNAAYLGAQIVATSATFEDSCVTKENLPQYLINLSSAPF